MHLFRTEMLFLHPPTPSPASPSRPRYGSRGVRLSHYGRTASREARREVAREGAQIAAVAEVADHTEIATVATACPAAAFARMQAA